MIDHLVMVEDEEEMISFFFLQIVPYRCQEGC
jgi:hypothetical protein